MLTILLAILMLVVFGKLLVLAIRAAWGITKILFSIIFLPVMIIGMACSGLMAVAIIVVVFIGLLSLVVI